MSALGNCLSCEAPLVVSHSYAQDGFGRVLAPDGLPAPLDSEGSARGPLASKWSVQCGECGRPVPDHPHQAALDAASSGRVAEERARKAAQPAPVLTPYTHGVGGPFEVLDALVQALVIRVTVLEAKVNTLEKAAEQAAHAHAAAVKAGRK